MEIENRIIPNTFRKSDFDYKLEFREGNFVIYSQRKDKFINFELMIVRKRRNENLLYNIKIGDEYLPSSEEWGMYGWTFSSLEECFEKISKLKIMRDFN